MGSGLKINSNVERLDSDRYGIRRIRLHRGREKISLYRDDSQSISSMVSTIRLITTTTLPSPLTSNGPPSHCGITPSHHLISGRFC